MFHNTKIIRTFLFLIGLLFVFLVYSFLSFSSATGDQVKLNSPDETANYFFASGFAKTQEIGYVEPLLGISKGVVHPRSMTTAGDRVVPVGFLGLVLFYGSLGIAFGAKAILFFTPFFAVLAALALYYVLKKIFPRRIAGLSAMLLLIHPAYWYYATRGLLPNVLFVDALIFGAFFLVIGFEKRQWAWYVLGGFFLGLALSVRLSEIIWVFSALSILACCALIQKRPSAIFATVCGLCIPLAMLFSMNTSVYGHPFIFGYQTSATVDSVISLDRTFELLTKFNPALWPEIKQNLSDTLARVKIYAFPFGFEPTIFKEHFYKYGVSMFWWFSLLIGFGFVLILKQGIVDAFRQRKFRLLLYVFLSVLVSFWLTAFYGSWVFFDNIKEEVTIGNSYVRYWLPMYILCIPYAAATLAWFLRAERGRSIRMFFVGSCVAMLIFFSGEIVLFHFPDSLISVSENIKSYQKSARWIKEITPPDAVIFSERSDKNFFPDRKVAQSFRNLAEKDLVPPLVEKVPVYYYGFWSEKDADYVSRHYFTEYNIHLEHVAEFANNERLFRVVKNNP